MEFDKTIDLVILGFIGLITSVCLIMIPYVVMGYWYSIGEDLMDNMKNIGELIYYISLIILAFAVIRAAYRGYKKYMAKDKKISEE